MYLCLYRWLSLYLSCLSVYKPTNLCECVCVFFVECICVRFCLFVHPSTIRSVHASIHLSVQMSVYCLSVCMSLSLFVYFSLSTHMPAYCLSIYNYVIICRNCLLSVKCCPLVPQELRFSARATLDVMMIQPIKG